MYGVRPRSTYSRTVISAGIVGICATSATRRARSRCGSERRSSPSSSIAPEKETSDAIARRSVVLPAPFGPDHRHPTRRVSTAAETLVQHLRAAERHAQAGEGDRAQIPLRLARSTTAKNGAPKNARHDADRQLGGRDDRAGEDIGEHEEPAPMRIVSGRSSR